MGVDARPSEAECYPLCFHEYGCLLPGFDPSANFDFVSAATVQYDGSERDFDTLVVCAASLKGTNASAIFLSKAHGVLAGAAVAERVFKLVDPSLSVRWNALDGASVPAGTVIGTIAGRACSILLAERIAVNFMQRMSGTATATRAMVEAVKGYPARNLDTRKTVPGAKDNHIAAAGGITHAIQRAREFVSQNELGGIEIVAETSTLDEVRQVLWLLKRARDCGVTRVMLGNMAKKDAEKEGGVDVALLREAVDLIGGRVATEALGNVTLQTVRKSRQQACPIYLLGR